MSRWVWPFPRPVGLGRIAWSGSAGASAWVAGARWAPSACLAGTAPLLLLAPLGLWLHQPISALALFLLVLALVRESRHAAAIGVVLVGYASHSALAIALSYAYPEPLAACLPDGAAYWSHQEQWIRTGEDPEYVLVNWLPAHFQLLFAVALLSYLTLGLGPLLSGFYEVDLMNYYVGRLLAASDGSPWTLLVGWHPWSILRGLCYAVLVVEVASLSLERLSGNTLAPARERATRFGVALVFFGADCLVKYGAAPLVREVLYAHMLSV